MFNIKTTRNRHPTGMLSAAHPGLTVASTARAKEVAPVGSVVSAVAEAAPKSTLPPSVPCSLCMDINTCLELGRCVRRTECNFAKFRARVQALRDQGDSF